MCLRCFALFLCFLLLATIDFDAEFLYIFAAFPFPPRLSFLFGITFSARVTTITTCFNYLYKQKMKRLAKNVTALELQSIDFWDAEMTLLFCFVDEIVGFLLR